MKLNEEQIVSEAIDRLDGDYLAHYGTKGMKWGVRKKYEIKGRRSGSTSYTGSRKKRVLSGAQKARLKRLASKTVKGLKNKKAEVSAALKERADSRINKRLMKRGTISKNAMASLSEKELDDKIRILKKQKELASLSKTRRQEVFDSFKSALAKSASDVVSAAVKDAGEKAVKKLLESVNQSQDFDADLLNKPTSKMTFEELQRASKRVDLLNKVEGYRTKKTNEAKKAEEESKAKKSETKKAKEESKAKKAETKNAEKESKEESKAKTEEESKAKKAEREQKRTDREVAIGRKLAKVKKDFKEASNERKAKIVAKQLADAIDSFGDEPAYVPKHSSGKTTTQTKFESAAKKGMDAVKQLIKSVDAATEPSPLNSRSVWGGAYGFNWGAASASSRIR